MTNKPIDRLLVKQLVQEVVEAAMQGVSNEACARVQGLMQSCPNCHFFNNKIELCTYRQCNSRPPARVIAFGCSLYIHHEEIPY